jgi:hypothetical protein
MMSIGSSRRRAQRAPAQCATAIGISLGGSAGHVCISSAESQSAAGDAAISGNLHRASVADERSSAARSLDSRAGGSAPASAPQSPSAQDRSKIKSIFRIIFAHARPTRALNLHIGDSGNSSFLSSATI